MAKDTELHLLVVPFLAEGQVFLFLFYFNFFGYPIAGGIFDDF